LKCTREQTCLECRTNGILCQYDFGLASKSTTQEESQPLDLATSVFTSPPTGGTEPRSWELAFLGLFGEEGLVRDFDSIHMPPYDPFGDPAGWSVVSDLHGTQSGEYSAMNPGKKTDRENTGHFTVSRFLARSLYTASDPRFLRSLLNRPTRLSLTACRNNRRRQVLMTRFSANS
jgi:hypothetical protein